MHGFAVAGRRETATHSSDGRRLATREPRAPDTTPRYVRRETSSPPHPFLRVSVGPTHPPRAATCEAQEPKRPMRPPLPSLSLNNPMLFFALSSFHLPRPALAPGRRHQIPSAAGAAAVLSLVSPPTKPLRRFPSCRPLRRGSSTTPPRITARIGVGTK